MNATADRAVSGPANILLVEDNRMDVELTLDAFREVNMNTTVQVVDNGRSALDYLFGVGAYADRTRYPLPDLVLLDLKMPDVGGQEVLSRIKLAPGLKRMPVVVLTSSKEKSDRARSYDSGANSYIVKPVSYAGFLEVVLQLQKYWIELNERPPELQA